MRVRLTNPTYASALIHALANQLDHDIQLVEDHTDILSPKLSVPETVTLPLYEGGPSARGKRQLEKKRLKKEAKRRGESRLLAAKQKD